MNDSMYWDNVVLLVSGILILIGLVLFFSIRSLVRYSQEERARQSLRARPRRREFSNQRPNFTQNEFRRPRDHDVDDGVDARDYDDDDGFGRAYQNEEAGNDDFGGNEDFAGEENYVAEDDYVSGDDYAREDEDQPDRNYPYDYERGQAKEPVYRRPAARKIPPVRRTVRKQFEFPVTAVWFVVGGIFGALITALSFYATTGNNSVTPVTASNVVQAENPPVDPVVSPPTVPPLPTTDNAIVEPPTTDGPDDLSDMAAGFAASLTRNLPMPVQPGVEITAITAEGSIVLIEFNIAEPVADDDVGRLQAEMEKRFFDGVCATTPFPDNIHGLSNRGITFLVNYKDLFDKAVVNFTAEPQFCSKPT